MQVSLTWLKEWVDFKLPVKELAYRLTMAGLEVDNVAGTGEDWANIFVGLVETVESHPNADRLKLCTVQVGHERFKVVCGATNVGVGQKIPFAKLGALLSDPNTGERHSLEAVRIRGVLSEGMICSQRELGLGSDHTGILVFPSDAPLDVSLGDYIGDTLLEVSVTPNRVDCLSMIGIAYEVSAITGNSVKTPPVTYPQEGLPIKSLLEVQVSDPDLCSRYTANVIQGVQIRPSPWWMQDRLVKAGINPINNVVDITNYVMLEFGQPLHAFDYDEIKDHTIIVRSAHDKESFLGLDGIERKLDPSMLVIADSSRAVGLAGVLGGHASEITTRTKNIVLESASFKSADIRRTVQTLKFRSEASLRFEKGLRPYLPAIALGRATKLILEVVGGTASEGIVDLFPGSQNDSPMINISQERVLQVLGMTVSVQEMMDVLNRLGFDCRDGNAFTLDVIVPYWRADISIENDLVEEIARVIGYDRVPTEMLSTAIPHHENQPLLNLKTRIQDHLVSCGMQEVINYSLTSLNNLEKLGLVLDDISPLRIANPMSAEQEYLRTNLNASLLLNLSHNQRYSGDGLALFEMGRTYIPQENGLPQEREMVSGVLWGSRSPLSWLGPPTDYDFFDAKGILESLMENLGMTVGFHPTEENIFHPTSAAVLRVGSIQVGKVGRIHPQMLEKMDLRSPAPILFELDLSMLVENPRNESYRYTPFPHFPAAILDVAILVDRSLGTKQVYQVIKQHPLVAQAILFDRYTGEGIASDQQSLAYRITFQSSERTLTRGEVDSSLTEILDHLRRELGAILRSSSR